MDSPLLTPKEAAAFMKVSRWMVAILVEREGLPAIVLSGGRGGRRTLRFRQDELQTWLEGRRERQVQALLDGTRHTRRRVVPIEGAR